MKTNIWIYCFVFFAIFFGLSACAPAVPQTPAPTPVPSYLQEKYESDVVLEEAQEVSAATLTENFHASAVRTGWYWALIAGMFVVASSFVTKLVPDKANRSVAGAFFLIVFVVAVIWAGNAGFNSVAPTIDSTVKQLSEEQANKSFAEGLDSVRKEQATNYQLISAPASSFGYDVMYCTTTINDKADCSLYSDFYHTESVNCKPRYDSNKKRVYPDKCDTKYIPDYPYLIKYWVGMATKAKYLAPDFYEIRCINDGALVECSKDEKGINNDSKNPAVFLHRDWRVPTELAENVSHIPALWLEVQAAASTGGPVVSVYTVGKYFHWGLAADSEEFFVSSKWYKALQSLAQMPGPEGAVFTYKDALGDPYSLYTMLYSEDGDLPTKVNPVFYIGFDHVPEALYAQTNAKAREFQGKWGPGKESINYVVVVNSELTAQLGGIEYIAKAIMGWLQDPSVWGLFSLPKNQTVVIVSASPDLSVYDALAFETGFTFGNEVVKTEVLNSVTAPQVFSWENVMGNTTSRYTSSNSGWALNYEYSDMRYVGGLTAMFYKNELPEYSDKYPQPDPNSPDCATADSAHVGYIRYQMCTQEYRQSNIKINETGKELILRDVQVKSDAVGNWGGVQVVFGAVLLLFVSGFRFAFLFETYSTY